MEVFFVLLACVCLTAPAFGNVSGGVPDPASRNSGTPYRVPISTDCALRQLAWEEGKALLPQQGDFPSLFDALQLGVCGLARPADTPRTTPRYEAQGVFCDCDSGSDAAPGTSTQPLKSLHLAVDKAVGLPVGERVVSVRGVCFLPQPLQLRTQASGLTVQNWDGAAAVLSGGVPLRIPKESWELVHKDAGWSIFHNVNNLYNLIDKPGQPKSDNVKFLGTFRHIDGCSGAVDAFDTTGEVGSWVYHDMSHPSDFAGQCYAILGDMWRAHSEIRVTTYVRQKTNLWRARVPAGTVEDIPGLRLGGRRSIRARWPNGDPELSGEWYVNEDTSGMGGGTYTRGWVVDDTDWATPAPRPKPQEVVVNGTAWPGVEWPSGDEYWSGMGDSGDFHIGVGGHCAGGAVEPPAGYWCADKPPRGIMTHKAPAGMVAPNTLPHFNDYTDPVGAVVHAWRGDGRWYTWQFLVEEWDKAERTLNFSQTVGGHQGGEGSHSGAEWYIENVKEECDWPSEFFYDAAEGMLYYSFNGTDPTGEEEWVVTQQRVLVNISSEYAFEDPSYEPVLNITLRGLSFRDTRHVFLDPHGLPSGGDWAIARSGAVLMEGTALCSIEDCVFSRLDGNGVFLSGFNQYTVIDSNEFEWIGGTAIASWGHTGKCLDAQCAQKLDFKIGPDGRAGEHPRFTVVSSNLAREIGIYQKQSSFYFQAVAAQTLVTGNVHFNGPRAGINLNDGFGGGDVVERNLLLNCVRESGDHGPINSWDRVPYITNFRNGQPSIIPSTRIIRRNLIYGLFNSQEDVDNDDGSAYYYSHSNVFVYATIGLKSDFNGHHNTHTANLYAYVQECEGDASLGAYNVFTHNMCVLRSGDSGGYGSTCNAAEGMVVGFNRIFTPEGTLQVCDRSWPAWQAGSTDKNTTVTSWPEDDELVRMARATLTQTDPRFLQPADERAWRRRGQQAPRVAPLARS
mmetsp:Transcript_13516/g.34497  ORF Transcript_13516/g.34497 Transcript_13516/m.34497 type:complete len:957 (-) Transcript_13516:26-2896(-)